MISKLLKTVCLALLVQLLCVGAAQAVTVVVVGSLSAGSPTYDRVTDRAGFPDSANDALPYAVIEIKTGSTGGTFTASVDNTTAFDSFLSLHSTFAPGSPSANLLFADDDGNGYPHAKLTATALAPNASYWLVVTSYSGAANAVFPLYGNYSITIDGDLASSYAVTATASPVAGGTVSCTPNPVGHGGSSTCTATPNAGYSFTAFSGDCTGASCLLSNVTAAKAVTASFTLNGYAIAATASPAGGGAVTCTPNPIPHGSSSTCTATPNAGYAFTAFSGDCTGTSCTLSNVTAAKSVTAGFALNAYAVTATASPLAGGTVTCTPNPVGHGSSTTCTATPNGSYTFTAFSGDCTGASCTLSNVTAAKSVTAVFALNTAPTATHVSVFGTAQVSVQLTGSHTYFDAQGDAQGASTFRWMRDSQSSGATKTAIANQTALTHTVAVAQLGEYLFFCVTPVATAGVTTGVEVCSAATAAVASATPNAYAITATANPAGGGTVICTPNPVQHGSSTTCTATPNGGYTFSAFSGDCTGASCTLSNVTSAKSLTASFALNTAPTATHVVVSGTAQVSRQLTGSFSYFDAEGDAQGATTFRWMRDSQSSGATKTAIANQSALTHTVLAAQEGAYLFWCVTPVATAGVATGAEVCSAATAAVVAPPPVTEFIPVLTTPPLAGVSGAPTVLNMAGLNGPTVMNGVVNTLAPLLGAGLRFVEQTATGTVVMAIPGGPNVVFAPLSVRTDDPRPNGLYPLGNGQYQIVSGGTALLVMPTVHNLREIVGLLPIGATLSLQNNGVITAQLGGLTYVVSPSVFVQKQPNPSGVSNFSTGSDGYLRFMDTAGNEQILYPAFGEVVVLGRISRLLDSNSTLNIQLDGTASIVFNGKAYTLVPDMTLGGVPADRAGQAWWQEGDTRYRLLNLQTPGASQGFTVRP